VASPKAFIAAKAALIVQAKQVVHQSGSHRMQQGRSVAPCALLLPSCLAPLHQLVLL
jgi:hypothetical protein